MRDREIERQRERERKRQRERERESDIERDRYRDKRQKERDRERERGGEERERGGRESERGVGEERDSTSVCKKGHSTYFFSNPEEEWKVILTERENKLKLIGKKESRSRNNEENMLCCLGSLVKNKNDKSKSVSAQCF